MHIIGPMASRADRRSRGGDGVQGVSRGHRAHLPRASVAVRGDEGSGAGGRQAHAELLSTRVAAAASTHPCSASSTEADALAAARLSRSTRRSMRAVDALRAAATTSGSTTRRSARNALTKLLGAAADSARRLPVGRRRARQELPDGLLLPVRAADAQDARCTSTSSCARCTASWTTCKGTVEPARRARRAHRAALPADLLRRVPRRRHHRRDDPAPAARRRCSSNGVGVRDDLELPARRALPRRPAPRPHPAGDRAAEGAARRGQRRRRHRLPAAHAGAGRGSTYTPLGAAADAAMLQAAFERLAEAARRGPGAAHRDARDPARRRAGGVVWFDFAVAVRRAALAERLPRDRRPVPHRAAVRRAADAAGQASEARRFTWLVDVLYDHASSSIMSAAAPPEALYTEGALANEFPRTASRLTEMQTKAYLEAPRREVMERLA